MNNNYNNALPVESMYQLTILEHETYRFLQDGHVVQHIKYHPLPNVGEHGCITLAVLLSMKKDQRIVFITSLFSSISLLVLPMHTVHDCQVAVIT